MRRVAENPNDKIMVTFNDIGEHIGPGSVTLSSFLGPLVREHVPVTLADWRNLDAATKATMWEEIQVCIYTLVCFVEPQDEIITCLTCLL